MNDPHGTKEQLMSELFDLRRKVALLEDEQAERMRVEAALRESERKHRTLVQNITGMVYRAYADWSAEIINESENICGYTNEELNSREDKWMGIIHPEDKERIVREGATLAEKAKALVQRYRIIDKSGQIRWVEDRKTSLFSENGDFKGIDGIVFDITEQKRAEDAVQEKEYIIESASSIIATADLDGYMTYANPAFRKAWGFNNESEYLGRPFWDYWVVGNKLDSIMKDLQSKGTWSGEVRAKRRDGDLFDVQVSAAMVFDGKGNPVALTSTSTDITARKTAEAALSEAKEKAEIILNGVADAIWALSPNGRVAFANEAAAYSFGYPSGRAMMDDPGSSKSIEKFEITDEHEHPVSIEQLPGRQALQGKRPPAQVLRFYRAEENEERWSVIKAIPIFDEQGQVRLSVIISHDITGIKYAERDRERLIAELKKALAEVKTLSGFLPICAKCKKIRDDKGYWQQIESYIRDRSEAEFSHSICPACLKELYPEFCRDDE